MLYNPISGSLDLILATTGISIYLIRVFFEKWTLTAGLAPWGSKFEANQSIIQYSDVLTDEIIIGQ